jgi:hypothetical protein
MKRLILLARFLPLSVFFLAGCSAPSKVINYSQKPNDIFVNANLKRFLRDNPSPKIVLRVPNTDDKATSNTSTGKENNLLYNAIEKEFLKSGFSVRDRGLFNEIINKSQSTDYSKIQDLTNTDLILEVVNIDPAIVYTTNKITLVYKKRQEEQVQEIGYKRYGASVEYRLIIVKNNEMAGTYKFNYKPCPEGCEISTFSFTGRRSKEIVLKETVSVNTLEEFIKFSTQDLIRSFKAG